MVLLQDDLVFSLGLFQRFVQGAVAGVPDLGLVLIADSVLHAVHGGDACIRVLGSNISIRVLRQDVCVCLSGGRGDLYRGLLFHYSILRRGLLLRSFLLFFGSFFLLLGSFLLLGGLLVLRGFLLLGGLLLHGHFLYGSFCLRGLSVFRRSRHTSVRGLLRRFCIGCKGGCGHTGRQSQGHSRHFEFLVRHKIRSFRSAHKRYYKTYLFVDKCPH